MAVTERRGGLQSWVPSIFAGFWILLAVFSAAYLFRVITTPQADRAESAAAATASVPAAQAAPPPLSEDQAQALMQSNDAKDKEISELKASVQDLSSQLAALNTRLKPLEKVLGPVAELTTSTAVTTSPPAPGAMRPPDPPKPPPPAASLEPPAPPPPTPKPVEAEASKPAEAEASKPAPAQDHAVDEAPAAAAEPEASSSAAATTDEPDDASSGSTETAALSPATSIPPGTTRFGIEIGSVDKQEGIRAMWRDLLTNHAALVAGLEARRVMAPDQKWRLVAGPFASAAEAMQACGLFKKADMPCEATVFAGDSF
jgi:outer membrane biosynthesis protein TonB